MLHNKKYQIIIAFCLFCILKVGGQHVYWGACPYVTLQQNFDVTRYGGEWFGAERYTDRFKPFTQCEKETYTPNGNAFTMVHEEYNTFTNDMRSVEGVATFKGESRFSVKFEDNPFNRIYWILKTDYDSYVVVYACVNILTIVNLKSIWILTRDQNPTQATLDTAREAITDQGLKTGPLKTIRQTDC